MKIYLTEESKLRAQIADLKQRLRERDEDVAYWIEQSDLGDEVRTCDHCGRQRWVGDMRASYYDHDLLGCSDDCIHAIDEDIELDASDWEDTKRALLNER